MTTHPVQAEIKAAHEVEATARLEFTRKAYQMLPKIEEPLILDVGCGSGLVTVELAALSGGTVFGLDIDETALSILEERSEKTGFSKRIKLVHQSLFTMDFAEGFFDIIWSEGSLHIIGFPEGLTEWARFLKPAGFIVFHEMCWLKENPPREIVEFVHPNFRGVETIDGYRKKIGKMSFTLIESFLVPSKLWENDFYSPILSELSTLKKKYSKDTYALHVLDREIESIKMYKKFSDSHSSAFFIMQKKPEEPE